MKEIAIKQGNKGGYAMVKAMVKLVIT